MELFRFILEGYAGSRGLGVFLGLALLSSVGHAQGPTLLQGQVVDAVSGVPVEGALVTLDLAPGGDPIEGGDRTSAFGFFRFEAGELASGSYELATSHPAYQPNTQAVIVGGVNSEALRIELQRISGENFFDVYTQVGGVVTGIPLGPSQETLVTLRKFSGAGGGAPEGVWEETTDALGAVVFRGLQSGFYEFTLTTSGDWEPYTSSRRFFDAPQQANFYLKPNYGNLSVNVTGWNPVATGITSITNAFVELTGFDPRDATAVVVPTRTGVTENSGGAVFTDLPPIDWQLVTRRLGYTSQTNWLSAAQIGGSFEVPLEIEDRHLKVALVTEDYENLEVFRGLSVWLQGLKNTNTEGFERELTGLEEGSGEADERLFESILPGRYRLFVNGAGNSPELTVHPGFFAEDTIEVYEGGVVEVDLALKTKTAVVYGRLLAADERASAADAADQSEAEILGRPLYQRKAADEIAFVEYELDPMLMPTMRTNIVQTDENGFFVANLKPARYGLLIEELDEYWGSHVNFELITPDPSERAPAAGSIVIPTLPSQPSGPTSPSDPTQPINSGLPDIPDFPDPPTGPENPVDPSGALDLLNAIGVLTDLLVIPPELLTPDLLDDDDDPQAIIDAAGTIGVDLPPALQAFLSGLVEDQGDGGGTEPVNPIVPPAPGALPANRPQFFAVGQGWPFYQEWSFDGRPPSNGTPLAGEPLVVESFQYSLDVFVRIQVLSVINTFGNGWLASPTRNLITGYSEERSVFISSDFSELAEVDGVATLTSAATGTLEADILPTAGNVTDFFAFHNVPSGNYSFDIPHDRFDFVGGEFVPGAGGQSILPINFTVPSWNAPGVLPDRDPALPDEFEPLSAMPPGGFTGFAGFGAVPKDNAFSITWEIQTWVPDPEVVGTELEEVQGEYESEPTLSTETGTRPAFIKPAYTGNLVFQSPPTMPVGPYQYWDDFFGRWQSVNRDLTLQVFYGGPSNNVPEEKASPYPDPETGASGSIPVPRTQLEITVVNEAEPDFELPNVGVRFRSGSSEFTANSGTTVVITDDVVPIDVTGQGWLGIPEVVEGGVQLRHSFKTHDASIPLREVIILVKRGMNLKGTATIMPTNPGGQATPLPQGEVLIRDRFGVILFKTRTDREGKWNLPETLELLDESSMSLYVEVRSPGYTPWRERFSPGDVEELDGGFFIVANASLEPLPQPELVSIEFDKADNGLFLPGVSRAGNQNNYTRINSPGPLTLEWTVSVDATPQQFELVGFDDADGNPGSPETITVFNLPKRLYLIDPKGSTENPLEGDSQFDWIPENPNNIAELRSWLSDILSGAAPNVFWDDTILFDPQGGNQWEGLGVSDIWRLPPGLFRPLVVLESENGGISLSDPYQALDISPTNTEPTTPRLLTGVRLPPWLAFTAELFGAVAAADSLAGGLKAEEDEIVEAAPMGRFRMRPEFEATITESEGKIDYDYRAAVKWSEGMATPDSGFLKLAANRMGLVFDTEIKVGARGSENRVFIEGGTGISNPEIDVNDYLPKALQNRVEAEGSAEVLAMMTLEEFITPRDEIFPVQMRLSNQVSGAVQATLRYNMTPLLSKIPTIGPVILSLDKTEALQILGRLQGGVGANFSNRWTTFFPDSRGGSTSALNHVYERHQFGGRSPGDAAVDNSLDLCFNFGVGMDINLAGGRLGASGTLSVTGENCGLTSLPALQITPNALTDWPPIERIDGALAASIEAYLDLWVTRYEKRWEWELIRISHQFGTDPVEDIRSIGLATTVFSPMSAAPSRFDPDGDDLVGDFYPTASFDIASSVDMKSGPAVEILSYTDINPATGAMRLMLSIGEGGTFAQPVPVTEVPGIVALSVVQASSGEWVAAWTEIAAGDLANPFPSSEIKAAHSEDGGVSWSAPVPVVELHGVATSLQLESISGGVGLAYLHTTEGPGASEFDFRLASWTAGSWSEVGGGTIGAKVQHISSASGNGRAAIAYQSSGSDLGLLLWDENGIGEPILISDQAGRAFAISRDGLSDFQVAWANTDGGIVRSTFNVNSQELEHQALFPEVYPVELAIADHGVGTAAQTVIAWVESGDIKSVWRANISATGEPLDAPAPVNPLSQGRHSDLRLRVDPNDQSVRVLTRFQDQGISLREYNIEFGGAPARLHLEVVGVTEDGRLQILVTGEPGTTATLETSSDLKTWSEVPGIDLTTLPTAVTLPATRAANAEAVFVRGLSR